MKQLIIFLVLGLSLLVVGSFVYFRLYQSSWLDQVIQITTNKRAGIMTATDKSGIPIVLEWQIMNAWAPALLVTMQDLSAFMVKTWVPIELDYLKANPGEVMRNEYLKPLQPLFAHGIEHVDWQKAGVLMGQFIKSAVESDPKGFFGEHDLSIFVIAKDKVTGNRLGFIQFLIKQEYPYGTVNLGNLAVDESARNRGLGKLLVSSLFKLLPATKNVFLYTRPSNIVAQKAYLAYGFKRDERPIADPMFAHGWLRMEYNASQSDTLQKKSQKLQ